MGSHLAIRGTKYMRNAHLFHAEYPEGHIKVFAVRSNIIQ